MGEIAPSAAVYLGGVDGIAGSCEYTNNLNYKIMNL